MTIEEIRKAIDKITKTDPISITRKRILLETLYALQEGRRPA